MAIALTNSYAKVAEKKMGDWGYGTLYLRLYAKFDEDNNIVLQSRVYNNGTYCYSNNCYATIQDENVQNNVRLNFNKGKEVILGTKTRIAETLTAKATFRCYGFGLSNTFTVTADVSLPADKAIGLDFDIGSATNITITRYNENYTRTVAASIGTFKETLMDKGTETQIAWQPSAESLYKQVPNANTGTITLTTTTYNGDTVIGTVTSTLKCRVTDSNPAINGVVITDSLEIVASNVLVRYLSKPKFEIDAKALNGASLVNYSVTELNSAEKTSESNEITAENTMTNNSFLVKVTDSRGNTTSANFSAEKFIEYILPAISKLDLVRTGENLDQIQASISGVWFKEPINNNDNTISLKYRYKTSNGEYSDYIDIEEVPTDSQFTIETLLNPDDGFDTNSVYTIEVVATDNLTSGNLTNLIGKAIPLIDHWSDEEKDYYNINAEIQQYGKTVYQEDTGYINAELTSDFKPYDDEVSNTPQYRKIGNLVELRGAVSPTKAQDAGWQATIFTLPEDFRPSFTFNKICQGSGSNKWLLTVNVDGTVTLARYSGTSNVAIPNTAWLHFHDVFLVD